MGPNAKMISINAAPVLVNTEGPALMKSAPSLAAAFQGGVELTAPPITTATATVAFTELAFLERATLTTHAAA